MTAFVALDQPFSGVMVTTIVSVTSLGASYLMTRVLPKESVMVVLMLPWVGTPGVCFSAMVEATAFGVAVPSTMKYREAAFTPLTVALVLFS